MPNEHEDRRGPRWGKSVSEMMQGKDPASVRKSMIEMTSSHGWAFLREILQNKIAFHEEAMIRPVNPAEPSQIFNHNRRHAEVMAFKGVLQLVEDVKAECQRILSGKGGE